MKYTKLIWNALEGGLGRKKAAYLKDTSLNTVMRNKVAREHGVSLDENFMLGDAVGSLAVSWRKKKASHRRLCSGLQALKQVLPPVEKTASKSAPRLYEKTASTFKKIAAAKKLRILEPLASSAEAEKLSALRETVDRDIVESLKKEANILTGFSKHPAAQNIGKGLAMGAGAAAPVGAAAYLTGSALSDKFTDDARDAALDTAKGVAGIGLGTYGLGKGVGHLLDERSANQAMQREKDMSSHHFGQMQQLQKMSSSHTDLENFQTAVYVDALLENAPQNEKVASVRALNREFAVDLLCKTLEKEAGIPRESIGKGWESHAGFEAFDPLTYFEKKAGGTGGHAIHVHTDPESGEEARTFNLYQGEKEPQDKAWFADTLPEDLQSQIEYTTNPEDYNPWGASLSLPMDQAEQIDALREMIASSPEHHETTNLDNQ